MHDIIIIVSKFLGYEREKTGYRWFRCFLHWKIQNIFFLVHLRCYQRTKFDLAVIHSFSNTNASAKSVGLVHRNQLAHRQPTNSGLLSPAQFRYVYTDVQIGA